MSALSSKQSSRGNLAISFNNNEPKSSNRNNTKNDKTASKYSSSALSNRQQSMQITFQKTGQKLKKNLSKQFQTFNINYDDKFTNQNKQGGKSAYKNTNNEKMTKSKTQAEMTTQAKSPLMKSNLSSKTKLSQYQQKYENSEVKNSNKEQLKKLREKSNRLKSPLSQNRSRKSSPQISPSYSKKSISSFKRVLSKGKLQKSNKNSEKNQPQNHEIQKTSFMKQKNISQRKSKTQRNDFQINFPHLITQSQSIYPSSSYPNTGPNTGKLSQNHQNLNFSKQSNKMYIAEEEQSEFIQNQETQQDYISEGLEQNDTNLGISQTYESKQIEAHNLHKDKPNGYGYQQLPLSYITAMQILQKKIQQHERTINKLQKQLKTKDTQYLQLQSHVKTLETELDQKQSIITQKQSEIKFLKGYLNEEKVNNRQALKQIAKNVYERTISAKKDVEKRRNQKDDMIDISAGKQKRKLFQNSPLKRNQENIQLLNSQTKSKPDLIQQLISPQIEQKKQLEQSLQRQRQLKQELQKQQLIKDDMMRSQILRQEALKKQIQNKKRYQYFQQNEVKENQWKSSRGYELQQSRSRLKRDTQMKREINEQSNFGSVNKRMRSISTAIKPTEQKQIGHTTHRPRNISFNNEAPNFGQYSQRKPTYQRTPLKTQQLKDPVLEKYIQAKSQFSSHPYNYTYNNFSNTKNKQINNEIHEGSQLKSDKKNRDTVSKMRQLMRAQKELIALNYKLQAFEKKILNTVQSTSSQDSNKIKSQQQKQTENLLLEELQKQYSMMKKQFEKKELQVKDLKMKLQAQG